MLRVLLENLFILLRRHFSDITSWKLYYCSKVSLWHGDVLQNPGASAFSLCQYQHVCAGPLPLQLLLVLYLHLSISVSEVEKRS